MAKSEEIINFLNELDLMLWKEEIGTTVYDACFEAALATLTPEQIAEIHEEYGEDALESHTMN